MCLAALIFTISKLYWIPADGLFDYWTYIDSREYQVLFSIITINKQKQEIGNMPTSHPTLFLFYYFKIGTVK